MHEDSREAYFDAAITRSGADAEQALHLRAALEQLLPADIGDEEIQTATERLRMLRNVKAWLPVGVALVLILAALLLPRIVTSGAIYLLERLDLPVDLQIPDVDFYAGTGTWSRPLSGEDRLACFGDLSATTSTNRWRPVWDRHPDDPAWLIHRIQITEHESGTPFPDVVGFGERMDPGNGWYALFEATRDAGKVIDYNTTGPRDGGIRVLDPDELRRRIDLFHQAAGADVISDRSVDRLGGQLQKLGPARTWRDHLEAGDLSRRNHRFGLHLSNIGILLVAEAERCVKDQDKDGLLRLLDSWEKLMEKCLKSSSSLLENVIITGLAHSTLPPLAAAAEELGIDAAPWRKRHAALEERDQNRRQQAEDATLLAMIERHGSMDAENILPALDRIVDFPLHVTAARLQPGCRVEQYLAARLYLPIAWLLSGVAVMLSLLGSSMRRKLAGSSTPWSRADMGILLGAGVLLPLLLWWIFRTLTPWGRLDISLWYGDFITPVSHGLGLILVLLFTPLAVAVGRLGKSAAVLGFKPCRPALAITLILPWIGLFASSAAVEASPVNHGLAALSAFQYLCSLVAGLFLLWQATGGGEGGRWRRAVLGTILRPAWLTGMAGVALLVPVLEWEERHWLARESIARIAAEGPAIEAEATRIGAGQIIQTLDLKTTDIDGGIRGR